VAATPEGDLPGALAPDRFAPDRCEPRVLQFSAGFVGAGPAAPVGLDKSQAYFNYFVGDQANWRSEVPAYEKVAYLGLYDGVDLVTWGQRTHLKYEFHVAPGADWRQIQVRYEGIQGLSIGEDGSLLVDLGEGWGSVTDDAPYIYQEVGGQRVEVPGRFVLLDQWTYSFDVTGPYDPAHELVIDPHLAWLTYLGHDPPGEDNGYAIAVDGAGNAYVTGSTRSSDMATAGAYGATYADNTDAFVARFSGAGSMLVYFTYLGGASSDFGYAIGVDSAGNACVTGETYSSGLATAGAYDTTHAGVSYYDAFVAKSNPAGSTLVYFTYVGGAAGDEAYAIALDAAGSAYVTGRTSSSDLATVEAYDTTYGGSSDAFVAKFNPVGNTLVYFSYLGGSGNDYGRAIALDRPGNVYVTGDTDASGLATPGAYDMRNEGGGYDAFIAEFGDMFAPAPARVDAVSHNGRPGRTVSSIEPSGVGVASITVTFSETVYFAGSCVQVNLVTFPGGVEVLGAAVLPEGVGGSGTSAMTIALASGAAVDTWVKVRLVAAAITDAAGNALDGEPAAGGSGRGYIYSSAVDLPTGDGVAGGDAVFYVGSLRGDCSGDLAIGPDDIRGFRDAWPARNLDADFRGVGFGPRPPDGRITLGDIAGFTSAYQRGIAEGIHLDPLPAGGSLAAGVTALPQLTEIPGERDLLRQAARRLLVGGPASLSATATAPLPYGRGPDMPAAAQPQGDQGADDDLPVRRPRPAVRVAPSAGAVLRL